MTSSLTDAAADSAQILVVSVIGIHFFCGGRMLCDESESLRQPPILPESFNPAIARNRGPHFPVLADLPRYRWCAGSTASEKALFLLAGTRGFGNMNL